MKRSYFLSMLLIVFLLTSSSWGEFKYAVLVNNSTYQIPEWALVADTLKSRYDGELFTWESSVWDVRSELSAYKPTHIAFVCEPLTASAGFVQIVWPFTRCLDDDPYGDAIWGIITGYDAEDALRLANCEPFVVKNMLGGTMSCDLNYYPQGIATSEATYNRIRFKYLDGTIIDTTDENLCPTDRTEFLMNMINADTIDIFMTSGHGNHDRWQLHYPDPGLEGYFMSSAGQLYGDPRVGPNINANSVNPKIYLALGNCYVGKLYNMNSMAPAWIHTGGASLMTGYVEWEGTYSHQHGGTKAFFARQGLYTWPEAFFLANQALYFDLDNHTPGTNPPDLNWSALYGDPALDARLDTESGVIPGSMYEEQIEIVPGDDKDTVTVRIVMNREDSPGYNGKWGNRHPTILFPFRAENPFIIKYDPECYTAEVTDNFFLMCIWWLGDSPLAAGETREFVFTCDHMVTSVIEITPDDPPVTVPQGGSFGFTGTLINNTEETQIVDAWTMAVGPQKDVYGPFKMLHDIELAPYDTLSGHFSQHVPNLAPLGFYDYIAYRGDYPSTVIDSSFFQIEVIPGISSGGDDLGWLLSGSFDGSAEYTNLPSDFALLGNYPNPFNARTQIGYQLSSLTAVNLAIYNLQGERVCTLFEGYQSPGTYSLIWDGRNQRGDEVVSGIYFYRLTSGDISESRPLLLLK